MSPWRCLVIGKRHSNYDDLSSQTWDSDLDASARCYGEAATGADGKMVLAPNAAASLVSKDCLA
jgi:hypothetical protein